MIRRLATLAVCLLVVSGMVLGGVTPGGSMVGTAAAEDAVAIEANNCSFSDYMFAPVALAAPGGCHLSIHPVNSTDQGDLDNYAQAAAVEDGEKRHIGQLQNRLQDTRSVAWSKAKIEIVQAMNNDSSESQAQVAAKAAVQDYYTVMETQTVHQYNAYMQQMFYVDASVTVQSLQAGNHYNSDFYQTENHTYTTLNGSDITVYSFNVDGGNVSLASPKDGGGNYGELRVDDPTQSNRQWTYLMDMTRWDQLLTDLQNQESQINGNIEAYVSEVYTQYDQGEINASDLMDPQTLAQEAATGYNSTGSYSYAAASLASLGYSGNMTASHTVEITDASGNVSATYEGTLFYSGDDVRSFATGQNYTFSDLSGTVYMAVQSGDRSQIRDLSQEGSYMTITEAINTQTGNQVNRTTITQKTYSTHNASQLASELDRLRELREEIEEISGGGIGGGGGVGGNGGLILGLIVAVLLLAYVGKDG